MAPDETIGQKRSISALIQRCMNNHQGYTKKYFLLKTLFVFVLPFLPFCFPPAFSPSTDFSLPLQQRKTAETACHPGNPTWYPEQLSNISLKVALLLSPSLSVPSLWPLSSQSWGVCSPRAHLTNWHTVELALGDWDCNADIALLHRHWLQNVSQLCKCHRAKASLAWHQWDHEMKQKKPKRLKGGGKVCLYVNHLYTCKTCSGLSCCGAYIFLGHKTQHSRFECQFCISSTVPITSLLADIASQPFPSPEQDNQSPIQTSQPFATLYLLFASENHRMSRWGVGR